MKNFKLKALIYILFIIKIVSTALIFNISYFPQEAVGLSIVSITLCLALSFDESLAMISLTILIASIILWLAFVLISFLSIRFMMFKKASMFIAFFLSLIEFVASFFISSLVTKIIAISFSTLCIGVFIFDFATMIKTRDVN